MHAGRTSNVFRGALDLVEPLRRGVGPPPLQEQDGRDSEEARHQRGGPDPARFFRLRCRRPGRRRLRLQPPLLLQWLPAPVASPHRHDPLPRSHELAGGSSFPRHARVPASEHRCLALAFFGTSEAGEGQTSPAIFRVGGWLPPTR